MNEENAASGAGFTEPCSNAEARALLVAYLDSYDEVFLLAGAAATGKTTLVADVLEDVDPSTPLFLLDASKIPEAGVVKAVCDQLDLQTDALDWDQTLEQISARLKQYEHAFLVIDNAHELRDRDLDALRLLSYLRSGRGPQLQMILVGQMAMLDSIDDTEMLRLELWRTRRAVLDDSLDGSEPVSSVAVQPVPDTAGEAGESEGATTTSAPPASEPDARADLAAMVVRRSVPEERVAVSSAGAAQHAQWWRRAPVPALWLLAIPVVLAVAYGLFSSGGDEPADVVPVLVKSSETSSAAAEDDLPAEPVATADAFASADPTNEQPAQVPADVTQQPPAERPLVVSSEADTNRIDLEDAAGQRSSDLSSELLPPVADASTDTNADTVALAPVKTNAETDSALDGPGQRGDTEGDAPVNEVAQVIAGTPVEEENAAAAGVDSINSIAQLMAAAADALRQNRLRTPPETSAWNYYNQVLTLSPGNAQALRGMQNIVRRYEELTRRAISRERFITAQTFINRGLSVAPGDAGLLALQEELDEAARQVVVEEDVVATAPLDAPPEVAPAREEPAEPGGFIGFLREVFSAEEE